MTYYSLTTLSGVGFGDMYPVNNFERILVTILLFGSIIAVSVVQGKLGNILLTINIGIHSVNNLILLTIEGVGEQYQDYFNLEHFILQLKRFNGGQMVKREFVDQIREFFDYKWNNDRN
jgi:hypothetical protein